jgi:hypothetical protein
MDAEMIRVYSPGPDGAGGGPAGWAGGLYAGGGGWDGPGGAGDGARPCSRTNFVNAPGSFGFNGMVGGGPGGGPPCDGAECRRSR